MNINFTPDAYDIRTYFTNEEEAVIQRLFQDDDAPVPYEEVTPEFKLKDLIKSIPHGIIEDTPLGRKQAPLIADLFLVSGFTAGAMIFPAPLNISLSEAAGLTTKNTFRGIEQLVINKAEKKKLLVEQQIAQAEASEDSTEDLRAELVTLKAELKSAKRAELVVKVVKYLLLGGLLASCGGVDLYKHLTEQESLQLTPKAGGILSVAVDRDLVEALRPIKTKSPTGVKIVIPKPLWHKIVALAVTFLGGTGSAYFNLSPVLTNGLLNGSTTSMKFLAEDIGWQKCSLGLGAATLATLAVNGAGLATPIANTFLKYSSPPLISLLNLDAAAAVRVSLEKLTGTDEEDDSVPADRRVPPAPMPIRLTVLAVATLFSLGMLYIKFSSNPPNSIKNNSTITVMNTTQPVTTQEIASENETLVHVYTYALALLMALPLKFTGRLAFNVMKDLPYSRVITPLVGASLLLAETVSYPFQSKMPIIAIVAFTAFAAIASRLVENTIKDYQLGKEKKKAAPSIVEMA